MGGFESLLRGIPVLFWISVAIVAGILEAMTVELVAIWFLVGALFAVLPAALNMGFNVQVIVFITTSVASMLLTRPFLKKILHVQKTETNADLVIGQKAVVILPIDNIQGKGRVFVDGLEWEARTMDGTALDKGSAVIVKERRGVKLIVEKISATKEEK